MLRRFHVTQAIPLMRKQFLVTQPQPTVLAYDHQRNEVGLIEPVYPHPSRFKAHAAIVRSPVAYLRWHTCPPTMRRRNPNMPCNQTKSTQ